MLLACAVGAAPALPSFDGVLRQNGPGRADAYLRPPFATNHASMLEQTSAGDLHMAWFSGAQEGADGVAIVHATFNTTRWSAARVVSRRDGFSNQNPVLYADDERRTLHVFHSSQPSGPHHMTAEANATVWHLSAPILPGGGAGSFSAPGCLFSAPGSFDKNRVVRAAHPTGADGRRAPRVTSALPRVCPGTSPRRFVGAADLRDGRGA